MPLLDLLTPFLEPEPSVALCDEPRLRPTVSGPRPGQASAPTLDSVAVVQISGQEESLQPVPLDVLAMKNRLRTVAARAALDKKRRGQQAERLIRSSQTEQQTRSLEPHLALSRFLTPHWKRLSTEEDGRRRRPQARALWSYLSHSNTIELVII